ncbi:MAG: hypothetical protein SNH28_01035 [Rikenellaceae bacterium]
MRKTAVSIKGINFCINGEETFKGKTWRGHSIEGLLPNSRMVNGIFDDQTDSTRYRWIYPDTKVWDAERNVSEFIENMSLWREHGLLAFTINLQGGSPQGYTANKQHPWCNTAITPEGELKADYMSRLERVIDRADELGMVVIVGVYYFGQEHYVNNEEAIKKGLENSVRWILERGYTNVLLEVVNETSCFKTSIFRPERIHELIALAKEVMVDGRTLLVSTSYGGGHIPSNKVIALSDYILLHGNGRHKPEQIVEMVEKTRMREAYTPKPIVFNEDDHFDFDKPWNNFVAATIVGASWGYFDFRKPGAAYEEGYQCIPAHWGITTTKKIGFFSLVKEWSE